MKVRTRMIISNYKVYGSKQMGKRRIIEDIIDESSTESEGEELDFVYEIDDEQIDSLLTSIDDLLNVAEVRFRRDSELLKIAANLKEIVEEITSETE